MAKTGHRTNSKCYYNATQTRTLSMTFAARHTDKYNLLQMRLEYGINGHFISSSRLIGFTDPQFRHATVLARSLLAL